MTLVELLSTLRAYEIKVWAEGDRLRYSAPSGALTPDIREELAKHKTDLLTFLNETDKARRATRVPIRRISREAKLLPSINQRRLWFIDQLQPNTAYNCSRADRIKGPLNIAALEQSLSEIVRRHEALRTTFSAIDGEPLQVITPALKLSLTLIDLREIADATERDTEAQRIMKDEVERPFDLATGPLFRAHLLCLGADEHLLLLTLHHIVTDGWSMGVLVGELTVLYQAFCNGGPSPLPELPIQYVDFAHWQSQYLQGEVLQQELSHWKERLKGSPEVSELLTDYPRPAVQNFRGASEPVVISNSLTEDLKALSKKQGVTLFMTLLAAFKTLLYRYSGQEDLVLGSPIAGRIRRELENLIGLFTNTLVLRTDLSGNPTFRELLNRVREIALDAYTHQDVPFEKLIQDRQLERSLSFAPLFQVMFVLQNTPESELRLLGSTVSPVTIKRETALFELFLSLTERNGALQGTLAYRTDLFRRATISRMISHFRVLLQGIVADPDRSISTLPLLMEKDEHQLLVEWNDTKKDYPKDKCLHQLFEERVERTPDAVAVALKGRELTYRVLNQRANQLAHHLRKLGVGPDMLVAICLERSLELVVGLLGILKAGGAYVPLDPEYPRQRIKFLLDDTQAPVLITQQRLLTELPKHAARVVCLDAEEDAFQKESAENPVGGTSSENLAYVIYTSGTTAEPKGVMISHRGICNRLFWGQDAYQLTNSDRVLQAFSLSFDFSTWEIFTSLVAGSGLIMAEPRKCQDSNYLLKLIRDSKVTFAGFVPSMLQAILDESEITGCNALRRVVCGGEVLPVELQERFFAWQSLELQNTYGPTEASIDVTFWNCKPENNSRSKRQKVPIGKPIANTQIYILDSQGQPVPVGVPGELHIGGVGLARGYLNRPALTAEKFIPNPFNNRPGARLYKTGDLARYLHDGNIEFLGRIDNQVKIRGFRIELGEIESVLSQHPAIQQAVVLAREDTPGDKRLVAYTVATEGFAPSVHDLRSYLQQKLPDYMVPSAFVFLDSIPLTLHGKVDRKSLPPPDGSRPELTATFIAPRNPTEATLAAIWARVLNMDRVGVRDNFFDMGGHSLLAVRLFSEVEKTFKTRPPLSSLFQEPTVEHLAAVISQKNPTSRPASLVAIQPDGSKPPFFCVHEFFGDVFCYLKLAHYLGPDQPFYALEPRGLNGADEPLADVPAMAAYYIDAIKTVQPRGPYALGGLCFGGVIAFEMAHQLSSQGEPVSLVALFDSGINSGYNHASGSRHGFEAISRGLPTWFIGALELNSSQWLDLIRLKHRVSKVNGGSKSGDSRRSRIIDEMAELFGFSERHRKVARAQQQAMMNYKPNIYPGRLTLFRARMQPLFSSHRPDKGWRRLAGGGVDIRVVPGNHLGMLQEPHVQYLAEELRACLDRASTEGKPEKDIAAIADCCVEGQQA